MGHKYPKQVVVSNESIDSETVNRNVRELTQELGRIDGDNFVSSIFAADADRLTYYSDSITMNVLQVVGANQATTHIFTNLGQSAFNNASDDEWQIYADAEVTTGDSVLWVIGCLMTGTTVAATGGLPVYALRLNGRVIYDSSNMFTDRGHAAQDMACVKAESEWLVDVPAGDHLIELVVKKDQAVPNGGVINPTLTVIEVTS